MNQTSSVVMHVLLVRITASVQPVKSENNCNGQGLPQPIVDNRGENSLVPCSALVGLEVVEESTCILIDQEITWLGTYISHIAILSQLTKSLLSDSDSISNKPNQTS